MKIQVTSRDGDDVKVTKVQNNKGILSWYTDRWGLIDVLITKFGRVRVLDTNIHLSSQTDKQFNGIVRDFLKV